jgi:large subunit ribosomal protein L6
MSRIGRKPVPVPKGVEVSLAGQAVTVKGPKGSLTQRVHPEMKVRLDNGAVLVERPSDARQHRALHGLGVLATWCWAAGNPAGAAA